MPAETTADTDCARMQRIANGDEAALRALIEAWQQPLLNFFYRSLRDQAEAEDLTQQVFIRLYKAAPSYQPTAKFSTWLFAIARRLLINEYRRRSRKLAQPCDPADFSQAPSTDEATSAELEETLAHALHKLPEKQRTAMLLMQQQELTYAEIAAVMGARENSVKSWVHRARKALRQELEKMEDQ